MADVPEKLSAAQRSKIRRLSAPRELAPDEEGGELNIVPFLDIITNVLMFVLATVSVTFSSTFDTVPPRSGGGARAAATPTLSLTVILVPEGISMKARGGGVGPGCEPGPGYVAGRTAAADGVQEYDYAALTACARKLKNASDEFKAETAVTISANADIPYQSIVSTIDALRKTDDGEDLFPEVNFGVPR